MKIRCMYSCHQCGLNKIPVDVPEREEDEDVTSWVEAATHVMGRDHNFRNIGCGSVHLDLWIPSPAGTQRLGEVVRS